ncbi:disulfide bond formation protein B [Pseudomonas urumqiensis]|uniref:disulfide bond formation protein B n=1 Tax=Stutzerimonas urumqiensis TaxID=638269 RepID=UPI000EB18976
MSKTPREQVISIRGTHQACRSVVRFGSEHSSRHLLADQQLIALSHRCACRTWLFSPLFCCLSGFHNEGNIVIYTSDRFLLFLLSLVCFTLVLGAVAIQELMGQYPCPLCIIQRYIFLVIALVALVGSVTSNRSANRVAGWASLILAGSGLAVAARLVYVQSHPGASCGIDRMQLLTDASPLAEWWPTVFQATGMCGDVLEPLLGLSMAQWGLVAFTTIIGALAVGLWKLR